MAASPFINISGAMANDDVFTSMTTTNKDKLNETGIMTDVVTGSAISISNDNVICENEQYNITFKVDSKWSGAFNGNISIKNVGEIGIQPVYLVESTNVPSIKLAKSVGFQIMSEEIIIS